MCPVVSVAWSEGMALRRMAPALPHAIAPLTVADHPALAQSLQAATEVWAACWGTTRAGLVSAQLSCLSAVLAVCPCFLPCVRGAAPM